MQVIFENENKRSNDRGMNSIGIVVCVESIGKCVEGEYIERFRIRRSRI